MNEAILLKYCLTPRQAEIVKLHLQGKKNIEIARMLKVDFPEVVSRTISAVKKRAALQEKDLHHAGNIPDGFAIKGTSTLIKDGQQALQWVKTDRDALAQQKAMQEAVAALCEELPRLPAIRAPRMPTNKLLNLYVITDYHFGMLSWAEETGDDWDTKIAEELLLRWFEAAISLSPDSEIGVLCNLGDLVHLDGLDAITPTGHNLLDSDTRFAKVVRVVIRTIRRVIDMLLHKHKRLHVIMAEGNHDMASSVWLREMLHSMYEREKRITIDRSPDPYYCVEHGLTSLFFHHGHKKKPESVDSVFTQKFRDVFGRTKYSYAHMGHMHHTWAKETNLMVVEQHRTLAASDAYASRGGWMSGREASCITYHKEFGYTGRTVITPEMLK